MPNFTIYLAGVGSALLGKEGAMACTIAVEELIGQHYNDQLKGIPKWKIGKFFRK